MTTKATHHNRPVRYSGLSNPLKMRADMPISIQPEYFGVEDDFVGIALDATNDWTVVKDSGATAAIVADTVGGELALTSTAVTDGDGASIQGNEIFAVAEGKNIWFETRVKCNDADQTDLCFGLTVNFATNPEAMLAAADRVVFQVDDGDASVLCKTEAGGTETSTDSGVDLEDDEYVVLAIQVVGEGGVNFFVNGQLVAQHDTNVTTENLAVGAMSVSGSATGTRATTLDYILCYETR